MIIISNVMHNTIEIIYTTAGQSRLHAGLLVKLMEIISPQLLPIHYRLFTSSLVWDTRSPHLLPFHYRLFTSNRVWDTRSPHLLPIHYRLFTSSRVWDTRSPHLLPIHYHLFTSSRVWDTRSPHLLSSIFYRRTMGQQKWKMKWSRFEYLLSFARLFNKESLHQIMEG